MEEHEPRKLYVGFGPRRGVSLGLATKPLDSSPFSKFR